MRCKSCNVELNDRETRLKEADGVTFVDLCGGCYTLSQQAVLDATRTLEMEVPLEDEPVPEENYTGFWNKFVAKHRLHDQWADGLGLMPVDELVRHKERKAYKAYFQFLALGYKPQVSAEMACNVNIHNRG